jgi:ABC-2 type transport system ATP-binding protein
VNAPPRDTPAVLAEGLGFAYHGSRGPRREVLNAVSFAVPAGSLYGVLGPNGSGKSTLFRLLATLARPGQGRLSVFGSDVVTAAAEVRRRLGVVFQSPALDGHLTVRENLEIHARLLGVGAPREIARAIGSELERFGVEARAGERVRTLSGGVRRRVELAKALLGRPDLLLLDEPSTGLDPNARLELRRALLALRASGTTVLLTTHLMDEADDCDRLLLLDRGRVVAEGTPLALRAAVGGDVLRASGDPQRLRDLVAACSPELAGRLAGLEGGALRCEDPRSRELAAALLAGFGDGVDGVALERPSLEDVFVHFTGHGLSGETER